MRKGRTVTVKERSTYEALAAQMYAGEIHGWWAYKKDEWEIEEIDHTRVKLTFAQAQARAGLAPVVKLVAIKATKAQLAAMVKKLAAAAEPDLAAEAMELIAA